METRERSFTIGDEQFDFELCFRPSVPLGNATIGQWWMPITPLYGQRSKERPGKNHRALVRSYWATVVERGEAQVRSAQETYLLAALVPNVRSEGSKTIFDDSFPSQPNPAALRKAVEPLQKALQLERDKTLSREQFHLKSLEVLGRTEFPPGVEEQYEVLVNSLLDEPIRLLMRGDQDIAVAKLFDLWKAFLNRRRHTENERIVLDVLSYEARTALHATYSVAWQRLLRGLYQGGELDEATARFMMFWHLDKRDSNTGVSLFHGHVFGLHPALGPFLMTACGQELLGAWLADSESVPTLGAVLHGVYVALCHYKMSREELRESRRGGLSQGRVSAGARHSGQRKWRGSRYQKEDR
jgi:hypothetical protein